MNGPFRRRRSNRDRTLPSWIATAANIFDPEYEFLVCGARTRLVFNDRRSARQFPSA